MITTVCFHDESCIGKSDRTRSYARLCNGTLASVPTDQTLAKLIAQHRGGVNRGHGIKRTNAPHRQPCFRGLAGRAHRHSRLNLFRLVKFRDLKGQQLLANPCAAGNLKLLEKVLAVALASQTLCPLENFTDTTTGAERLIEVVAARCRC